MTPILRMQAEYGCDPLWVVDDEGLTNVSPQDLGLPSELADALDDWAEDLNSIYPDDDPGSAEFPSPEAEAAWKSEGRRLASALRDVVGSRYRIDFRE